MSSGTTFAAEQPPEWLPLLPHAMPDKEPPVAAQLRAVAQGNGADPTLQSCVDQVLGKHGRRAESPALSVALVDLTGTRRDAPIAAMRNATVGKYAASVAKLGALLSAHQLRYDARAKATALLAANDKATVADLKAALSGMYGAGDASYKPDAVLDIKRGGKSFTVDFQPDYALTMRRMAQRSDNHAASEVIHKLGFPYIASVLWSHALYRTSMGGGLWVGRGFGRPTTSWHRDPAANLSHGVSAWSIATAMTLLGQGKFLDKETSESVKHFLSDSMFRIKFIRGFMAMGLKVNADGKGLPPTKRVALWRKSGTMDGLSHDAALIERTACLDKRCRKTAALRYVAVALADSAATQWLLPDLIQGFDQCILSNAPAQAMNASSH